MAFWHDLERYGNRTALIEPSGRNLTFCELALAADKRWPIRNQLILLELDNRIESIIAYIGALRRNLPAIVINAGDELTADRMIKTFRPAARWSPERGVELLADRGPPIHAELAIMLSTSGTTGSTKLVRLSGAAVDANAQAIGEYLSLNSTDRAITTLPPGYSYGLSVVNSHLAAGASLILYEGSVLDPAFRVTIEELEATSFAGVPYTYELLQRLDFFNRIPDSLRTMTQAGGRLPATAVKTIGAAARAKGLSFFVMYGQTEATARMAYLPPQRLADHPDCIGLPIPGGHFELIDPETGVAQEDRGELVYSGPNVMMGYAENANDLSKGAELDRLRTGDLAEKVGDLFRITGRVSRFLKLFGLRLSLDEIERLAAERRWPLIATGTDDLLVLASERGELGDIVTHEIAGLFGLPLTCIEFVSFAVTPRLPSGKIAYQSVIMLASKARAEREAAAGGRAEDALLKLFRRTFPHRAVTIEDSFLSLDGDSLSYITISMGIEEIAGSLASDWESLPISAFARLSSAPKSRFWARIEPGIAVRAIAPLMVVANHAGSTAVRGGAALLLIVAGMNFARFSGQHLLDQRPAIVARSILLNVLLPYWLILGAFQLWRGATNMADFMLVNNFLGHSGAVPFETWFVQVLAQSVLLYTTLSLLPRSRKLLAEQPFTASFALLLAAASLAVMHFVLLRALLHNGGRELTWQLWLFATGFAVHFADTNRRRILVLSVAILASTLLYGADPSRMTAVIGGTSLLLWVRRIPMPLMLLPAVTLVGSSSLFIYMMHGRAPTHTATGDWAVDVLRIGLGVAIAIATWFFYEEGTKLTRRLYAEASARWRLFAAKRAIHPIG